MRKLNLNSFKYNTLFVEQERQNKVEIHVLLYYTKNERTVVECVAQFNNILIMFNSAQNQYLQLRKEEDHADPLFEDRLLGF